MITQKYLNEIFDYDRHTGILRNKIRRLPRGKKGASVGSNCKGYLVVTINKKTI